MGQIRVRPDEVWDKDVYYGGRPQSKSAEECRKELTLAITSINLCLRNG